MATQPNSQKHPCKYCGVLVGSGAYMHLQKHKRNGDALGYLQNGKKQSILAALQAAFDGTKFELASLQDRLASITLLRNEETRLIHLLGSLEKALGEYMTKEEGERNAIPQPTQR